MTGPNSVGGKLPDAQEMVNLSPVDKKDIANTAIQTLGADAVDAKKDIATNALQTLSPKPARMLSDRCKDLVGLYPTEYGSGLSAPSLLSS
jgi:predicted lipoprotein